MPAMRHQWNLERRFFVGAIGVAASTFLSWARQASAVIDVASDPETETSSIVMRRDPRPSFVYCLISSRGSIPSASR